MAAKTDQNFEDSSNNQPGKGSPAKRRIPRAGHTPEIRKREGFERQIDLVKAALKAWEVRLAPEKRPRGYAD